MSVNRSINTRLIVKSLAILGTVIAVYIFVNMVLPRLMNWFTLTYIARPLLWFLVILVTLLISKYSAEAKLDFTSSLVKLSLFVGVFQVLALVTAGLFASFGRSPYLFTPKAMLMNFVLATSTLVGMEFSRAYLINTFARRYFALGLALVALLYTVISIPPASFTIPRDPRQTIVFLGSTPLPLFAENLLASLLAFLGGPLASLTYRGVLQAFEWYSPILPDLPWAVTGFVGVMVPVTAILVVGYLNRDKLPEAESQSNGRPGIIGWVGIAILGVVIIWLFSGLFGFQPILIAGRSMSPAIKLGDIAVTIKVPPDSIKVGDIIQYQTERGTTIHRVIKIQKQGNTMLFVTKGDANNTPDAAPVHPDQIAGKVSFVIPKLGWIAIGIKNAIGGAWRGK